MSKSPNYLSLSDFALSKSSSEDLFHYQLSEEGILDDFPGWVREATFTEGRKYRFDFALPFHKLAVEIEGGIRPGKPWVKSRHSNAQGFSEDCSKYNLAAGLGWHVLRFTSGMVEDGSAIETVKIYIQNRIDSGKHTFRKHQRARNFSYPSGK